MIFLATQSRLSFSLSYKIVLVSSKGMKELFVMTSHIFLSIESTKNFIIIHHS